MQKDRKDKTLKKNMHACTHTQTHTQRVNFHSELPAIQQMYLCEITQTQTALFCTRRLPTAPPQVIIAGIKSYKLAL